MAKLANYQHLLSMSTPSLFALMTHQSKPRRLLVTAVKLAIAAAILYLLFGRIQSTDGFKRLLEQPKQWGYLATAWLMVLLGFSLSFVRWFLFVRALGLDFHLRDAFRLGTLGFMFNQVSLGSIGGDLLKAVFIAREQHGNRTEAVATVVIDRAIGLFAMLIVGSIGLIFLNAQVTDHGLINQLRYVVWTALGIGTLGFSWAMSPLATGPRVREIADGLPIVGHTLSRMIDAAGTYHQRRGYVFLGLMLGMMTHSLLILAFWLIGKGLPVFEPSLTQCASVVPPCLLAGTLPLTPGGVGTLEGAVEYFYSKIGAPQGDGTLVALAFRAMMYAFAAVGAVYYVSARKKIDEMLHEAEELAEEID